jgi:hypothetical protein
MKKRYWMAAVLFCAVECVYGQAERIDSVLEVYRRNYQPEKLYLHFDKSVYSAGETIWFKAYLMAGGGLSDMSKNFYVDIYTAGGKLLQHFVTPVFQSSARGQFDVPADYKGGAIHLRAYTQWMLNFDPAFVFSKDIYVMGAAGALPGHSVSPGHRASSDHSDSPDHSVSPDPGTSIRWFPEGGELVAGIRTRVAFLAADGRGRPVEVSGSVMTDKGVFVDSFWSRHDGMGSILLTARSGERYTASWRDATGKQYTTVLPAVMSGGVGMYVQPMPKRTMVLLTRTQEAGADDKTLHLAAYMNQQLVYRSRFDLSSRASGLAQIPTDKLASGILQITVFNARLTPVAERIVFINNHNYSFQTDVTVEAKSLEPKGRNVIEISSGDTLAANLSVAITDGELGGEKGNIISQLLLCGDLRGYVQDPAYYFDRDTDSTREELDLVMLTHGWRKFDWGEALSGGRPALRYGKDSDYLQIRGKIDIPPRVATSPLDKLVLILQARDSSRQMITVPVGKDGSFMLSGAVFFDTVKVFYAFVGDKKFERKAELKFQNGFVRPPATGGEATGAAWMHDGGVSQGGGSARGAVHAGEGAAGGGLPDEAAVRRERFFSEKKAELEKMQKAATLDSVVVKGRLRNPLDVLDEKYTSGLFRGDAARQFDLTNDERANGRYNVFQYLQGLIAGLQIVQNDGSWHLNWRGETPALFIDEMRVDAVQLDNLPLTDVAYVKVFRPPFFGSPVNGGGGAIAVYTRKGSDVRADTGGSPALSYQYLEGYSPFKQFYSPDYAGAAPATTDVRTTLYWKPYIMLDSHTRQARIEFYNNDVSRRLRIIVEGVDAAGKLTRVEKMVN